MLLLESKSCFYQLMNNSFCPFCGSTEINWLLLSPTFGEEPAFPRFFEYAKFGVKDMLTGKCNHSDGLLTSSYLTETCKYLKDGRRTWVYRLKSDFAYNEACRKAFHEAVTLWSELEHPNLLACTGVMVEEAGWQGVMLEPLNCVTLEAYLFENPSFVTDGAELERIVTEVTDALAYLHSQGVCHLDLHPRNILLTKGEHKVKLTNLFSPYVHLSNALSLKSDGYVAPECFSGESVSDPIRSDIYSLGCFISYLYDMASLPYRYRHVVQRAGNDIPAQRPSCIKAFRRGVAQSHMQMLLAKGFMWILLVLLACWGLFCLTTSSPEDEIHFVEPTADNTYIYDSISGQGYYLNDSAMAVRKAMLEHQKEKMMKEYDRKVNDIFKKAFRKKAAPVIHEIYTEKNVDGESGAFASITNRGMKQLVEIQEELSEQYDLDPVTAANMAASVIDELTRQRLNELKRKE